MGMKAETPHGSSSFCPHHFATVRFPSRERQNHDGQNHEVSATTFR
jgi:hypothetical protein